MMKKFSVVAVALALVMCAAAQRTTRKGLRPAEQPSDASASARLDTLSPAPAHAVDVNGYDKPLRSRRETFFVTNNSGRDIARIALSLAYYDAQGRQLHAASHNVQADIPAGETRQLALRSWDRQLSFYYMRSAAPPRTQDVTPFDVSISIDTLFVK